MGKTNPRVLARQKRIKRIRKKIAGTPERPRLRVFKSARHTYAQLIDDTRGHTLVATSTLDRAIREDGSLAGKTARARRVGELIAERARAAGITAVVFDRGGYIYHGRVKAVSEGAREGGLEF